MPIRLHLPKTPPIYLRGRAYTQIRTMASSSAIPNAPDIDRTIVKELRKYGACDISDALLKLKVPGAGFLPDLIPYCIPPKQSIGDSDVSSDDRFISIRPASTVLFIAKKDDGSGHPPSNIPDGKHWADLAVSQPGNFVVISQPEGQKNAVLGGIMALRMKKLLAQGVVVHGRVRDISELKESGLMVCRTLLFTSVSFFFCHYWKLGFMFIHCPVTTLMRVFSRFIFISYYIFIFMQSTLRHPDLRLQSYYRHLYTSSLMNPPNTDLGKRNFHRGSRCRK